MAEKIINIQDKLNEKIYREELDAQTLSIKCICEVVKQKLILLAYPFNQDTEAFIAAAVKHAFIRVQKNYETTKEIYEDCSPFMAHLKMVDLISNHAIELMPGK